MPPLVSLKCLPPVSASVSWAFAPSGDKMLTVLSELPPDSTSMVAAPVVDVRFNCELSCISPMTRSPRIRVWAVLWATVIRSLELARIAR